MSVAEISVLHVLPHPGGGGETYVRTLAMLEGVACERTFVSPSDRVPSAILPAIRSAVRVRRRAARYDLLHVHGEVAGGLCLPAMARRPTVVTLHGLNALRRFSGIRGAIARRNLRAVVGTADRTICVSRTELDEVRAIDAKLADRCVLIPNGVAVRPRRPGEERRAVRAALGVEEDAVLALWVGALAEPKQPRAAVRAAVEVVRGGDPLCLGIVGDGPLRAAAEREAEAASPGAVRFLGRRDDVERLLAAGDVFLLVSDREGLPFALLEAMAAGLVPVVSAGHAAEDAVGEAGIAVAPGDAAGLVDALRALVGSAELRRKLGAAARARIAERFSVQSMLRSTGDLYQAVLEGRGAP